MSKQEFILKLLAEGRQYFQMILPVLMAWVAPSPIGRNKENKGE